MELRTGEPKEPRIGSFQWWFRHRETGGITVAQVPNWPIAAIAVVWVLRRFLAEDGGWDRAGFWLSTALWLFWGTDEALRGVNPFRRVLGAGVIAWQLLSLFA